MKNLVVSNCLLLTLVSCGSDPILQPFAEKFSTAGHKNKAFAGRVIFQDLTSSQLSEIRVIRETGSGLIKPINKSYDQVDGLWVMQAKSDVWFKIPDHSQAWVGEPPANFDGTAHLGGLKIYYRSSPVLRLVGTINQSLKSPSWVVNSGATKSPVPSPWVAKH